MGTLTGTPTRNIVRMKFCLLLLAAFVACHDAQPLSYGVLDDAVDKVKGVNDAVNDASDKLVDKLKTIGEYVEKILNKETDIQKQLQQMQADLEQLIKDAKVWYEEYKKKAKASAEQYLEALYVEISDQAVSIMLTAVDEVLEAYEKIVLVVMDFFDSILGKDNSIGRGIYDQMDDMLVGFIDQIFNAARSALKDLSKLDDYDFTQLIDKILVRAEGAVNVKLAEFRRDLDKKVGISETVYGNSKMDQIRRARKIKAFVDKLLKAKADIEGKIGQMKEDIEQLIVETKQWYEEFKKSSKASAEKKLEELYAKVSVQVTDIALLAVNEVLEAYEQVVVTVLDFFNEILGEQNKISRQIYEQMDQLLTSFIEQIFAALRSVLEDLKSLDDYDLTSFIDKIVDTVETAVNARVGEFKRSLEQKLKISPVVYGNSKIDQIRRARKIKALVDDVLKKGGELKAKVEQMKNDVEQLIVDTKQWFEELKTTKKASVEKYLEDLYNHIIGQVTDIFLTALEEVLEAYEKIIVKINDSFLDILGKNNLGQKVYEYMDQMLVDFIDTMFAALRSVLADLDFLDDYEWTAFIEKIIAHVEAAVEERLEVFRREMKQKLVLAY